MSELQQKIIIGLTGNIATGKSVVRQMLRYIGAYTIDADHISHQAMMPGAPAYDPIIRMFGNFVLSDDLHINRRRLGRIVFNDEQALEILEGIVHPVVRLGIDALIRQSSSPLIVIEAIKLLEGPLAEKVSTVWVVDAKPETQIERLIHNRSMTREEAQMRLDAQDDQANKLAAANFIIYNGGDASQTWQQVQRAYNSLIQQKKLSLRPQVIDEPVVEEEPAIEQTTEFINVDANVVRIERGSPGNAQAIADLITQQTQQPMSYASVLTSFGEHSYMVAMRSGRIVAMLTWAVEDLVLRIDQIDLTVTDVPAGSDILIRLLEAAEVLSGELQAEAVFIAARTRASQQARVAYRTALDKAGYEQIEVDRVETPSWKRATAELGTLEDRYFDYKILRSERITRPI